ncbi:hypothetical protein EDD34_3760 [Myceligenerans xiligouense]|uniref:Uncharacterized protein n=1 Tax=Myceligenerans xiligouense TaxID=253184 RepID=A0A3N4YWP1_9MICO|nr:hypothetical protein EDD34_3760 [Myceligenerans xiligouense]
MQLLGLVILATSLVGAAGPSAAAYDHEAELGVTAEGVAFDGRHVSRGTSLEYTVRPLDGDNASYVRRYLNGSERHSGWAAFHEAPDRYPDGYCVTWVRVDRYDWGEWMDGPACTEPEEAAPAATEEPGGEPPADGPAADPAPTPEVTQQPTPAPENPQPEPEPSPSPSEPTPEPSPSTPGPSPSASPSAEPDPVISSKPNDPASSIIRSFGRPSAAADESGALPQGGLVWMWLILGGIGAAAAGGVLMMLRRG